jgi:lipid-binding SYLF domain-containing protein
VTGNEASLGFQIGGQQSFVVILLMNTNAAAALTAPISEFGGEARGTAGNSSAGAEGTASSMDFPYLVYTDRKGFFGGAAVKGGAISPANDDNLRYYEAYVSMQDILYNQKVKPTESVLELTKRITQDSAMAKK